MGVTMTTTTATSPPVRCYAIVNARGLISRVADHAMLTLPGERLIRGWFVPDVKKARVKR